MCDVQTEVDMWRAAMDREPSDGLKYLIDSAAQTMEGMVLENRLFERGEVVEIRCSPNNKYDGKFAIILEGHGHGRFLVLVGTNKTVLNREHLVRA